MTLDTHRTQRLAQGVKDRSSDDYLNALFTGTDASDLSDVETADLNENDSDLSSVTRMGACSEPDVWRILHGNDEPDETYFSPTVAPDYL